jgi:hypothetical protein
VENVAVISGTLRISDLQNVLYQTSTENGHQTIRWEIVSG